VLFGIGLGGDYMIIPLMAADLFGTLTLGRPLPADERDERRAREAFARAFEKAAAAAPWDLDGPVYWNRYVAPRTPA